MDSVKSVRLIHGSRMNTNALLINVNQMRFSRLMVLAYLVLNILTHKIINVLPRDAVVDKLL